MTPWAFPSVSYKDLAVFQMTNIIISYKFYLLQFSTILGTIYNTAIFHTICDFYFPNSKQRKKITNNEMTNAMQ